MEFDNSFEVPLPPAEAWKVLLDIKRIAPCMPGAELTEVLDQNSYKGKIGVRLGPVALTFAGVVKFEQIDAATHTARVAAQGTDAKGRGGANATSEVFRTGQPARIDDVRDIASGAIGDTARRVGLRGEHAIRMLLGPPPQHMRNAALMLVKGILGAQQHRSVRAPLQGHARRSEDLRLRWSRHRLIGD